MNVRPMTNSTPDLKKEEHESKPKNIVRKAKEQVEKVINVKENIHASADSLFFVRLFARACQPVC